MFMGKSPEHSCADEVSLSENIHEIPSDDVLLKVSNIFNALQSETRLTILYLLSGSDLCVRELEAVLNVSQSAISHSLRILRQLDLVRVRKEGRFAVYHIADEHVRQ